MADRADVEAAFRTYYMTGPLLEDWVSWAHLFTDDAVYREHFWGTFRGPDEIQTWMESVLAAVPQMYAPLKWYVIDGDRVVYEIENRCDNPEPGGDPIGFPSVQVITYAGDGKWASEEDWWVLPEARKAAEAYAAAAKAHDPDHASRMTRENWGEWVDWARPPAGTEVKPSWLGRDDVRPVLRPRDLTVGVRT
jgi:hypothetical protein